MTFGFSRDDINTFLPDYIDEQELLLRDPFQSLDDAGVGQLVEMAVNKGRVDEEGRSKCGICGEHGGDPDSIENCEGRARLRVVLAVPRADRATGCRARQHQGAQGRLVARPAASFARVETTPGCCQSCSPQVAPPVFPRGPRLLRP